MGELTFSNKLTNTLCQIKTEQGGEAPMKSGRTLEEDAVVVEAGEAGDGRATEQGGGASRKSRRKRGEEVVVAEAEDAVPLESLAPQGPQLQVCDPQPSSLNL